MNKLSMNDVIAAAANEEEYIGFCLACGDEAYGVEPDARRYECESCGEQKVYGAQEILLMMVAA
jgi:predicted RNA-binding Zn-ribbon protein involved in translation (DUF1610 family)